MIHCSLLLAVHLSGDIDLGELIVGVGTLALAGITWRLARTTGRSVEAARQSADAARESAKAERDSVEAMAMPYIIAVPQAAYDEISRVDEDTDGAPWTLKLRLWNLGSGPGIVTNIRLACRSEQQLVDLPRGIPLAPDGKFPADVGVGAWPAGSISGTLTIDYLHSHGRSYRTDSDVIIEENLLRCLTFRRSFAEEPSGD